MAELPVIIDLHKIIEPYLDGGKLLTYTSRYLTKPGDHYGSVMMAINVKIQTKSGITKELPLVAKLPPITNEFLWLMFQPERTCLRENAIYTCLLPAIHQLQREAGIQESKLFNGISKYYGSRISLDPNATKVDKNAVLLQENLQSSGFRPGNRHVMFDLQHAQIVLKQLAQFHALSLALRLKKQQEYDTNVRPHFCKFNPNVGLSKDTQMQLETDLLDDVTRATNNDEIILQRVRELIEDYNIFMSRTHDTEDGLYTTIAHLDLWINNIMIKYDERNLPRQVKLIDFQMAIYESCVYDVIYFMFSSLEVKVLEHHTNELLQFYYNSFIECLNSVGVCTEAYSFESFMKEMNKHSSVAICVCLFIIRIVLADDSVMPDNFEDMNMDVMSNNVNEFVIQRTADVIRLAQKLNFFFSN